MTGSLSGSKTYGYDANGVVRSVTTNGSTLYLSADYEDRYTRFDFGTGPGQSATYATAGYNGLGARFTRHSADGQDHNMAYDGVSPGAPALYDSDGQTLYTPGLAQTSYASGQTLYTNVDALGSVHDTQTNGSGGPSDVLRTEAFGTTLTASSEPDALSLGWGASSSYQTDSDTGLLLLGNRYYDASTGRFLSPDPAGDGDNWYAYCDNDPLDELDPTGLNGGDDLSDYNNFFSEQWSKVQSWARGLRVAGEFVLGLGSTDRTYDQFSYESQQLQVSIDATQINSDISNGIMSNDIGTLQAFINTVNEPGDGTQAQLGAVHWSATRVGKNKLQIKVTNVISFNSLVLHLPQIGNLMIGRANGLKSYHLLPEHWHRLPDGFGPFGDINQTIIWDESFPAPDTGDGGKGHHNWNY